MEGHSTRVCELCGTLYPPNVEWCPADGEPTVAAMIVRSSPSGRQAPVAPARFAENFRPSLTGRAAIPATQLPKKNFVEEPRLPAEEETSIRISLPQQPRAVYSESQPSLKAPVLTGLRELRSFSEEDQLRRPNQDPDELETAAQPRRAAPRPSTSERQPQRAPTPAPQQSQRRPKLTQPEVEPIRAPQKAPQPVQREPEAETRVAITADKKVEEPTRVAITAEKPPEPRRPAPAPLPAPTAAPIPLSVTRPEPIQAPSLKLTAIPLAYTEPEVKPSALARFRDWFVPWITELKESAILRLIALVLLLIVVAKGLLALVQLGE